MNQGGVHSNILTSDIMTDRGGRLVAAPVAARAGVLSAQPLYARFGLIPTRVNELSER